MVLVHSELKQLKPQNLLPGPMLSEVGSCILVCAAHLTTVSKGLDIYTS